MMVLFSSCFLQKQLPFSSFKVKCRQGEVGAWIVATPPTSTIYKVGYNDFYNLVLPGRWWLQNLIQRHVWKKSLSAFFICFVRDFIQSLSEVLIWSIKEIFISKNAEFEADFGSIEKFAKKNSCQNIINIFMDSNHQHWILSFMIPI
jgi:hypothetical protein